MMDMNMKVDISEEAMDALKDVGTRLKELNEKVMALERKNDDAQDRVLSLEKKNEQMRGELAVLKKAFAKAEKTCAKNQEALSQAIRLLLSLMKGSVAEICCKMILLDIKTEMVMEELDVGIDDMAGVVTAIRQTVAQQMGLANGKDDDDMDGDKDGNVFGGIDMAGGKDGVTGKDMFDDDELVKMGRVLRTIMRNEINVEEEDQDESELVMNVKGDEVDWESVIGMITGETGSPDDGITGHGRYCDDGCDEEEEDDEDEEFMLWNVLMNGKKVMS